MNKRALILILSILATIIPFTPATQAQAYTPLTATEWSNFINLCFEFIDWIHAANNYFGPTSASGTFGTAITDNSVIDLTINEGPICLMYAANHYRGLDASTTPISVPSTNQLKNVNYCDSTWVQSPNSCDVVNPTIGKFKYTYCNVDAIDCPTSNIQNGYFVNAVEFSASWTLDFNRNFNTCSASMHFNRLPIIPTYEREYTDAQPGNGCNNKLVAMGWTATDIKKITHSKFLEDFPENEIPFAASFGRVCATPFGDIDLGPSGSFLINKIVPSGFLYMITGVGMSIGIDAQANSFLTINDPSGLFDEPIRVSSGVFTDTAPAPDEYYKWQLWRLGYNPSTVNETTSYPITYTITTTNNIASNEKACYFLPDMAEGNVGAAYDNQMIGLEVTGVPSGDSETANNGLIATWTKPDFLTNVVWTIKNDTDDVLEGITLTATGLTSGATWSCETDSLGQCTMSGVYDQSITVVPTEPPFGFNPESALIIFETECDSTTCEKELIFNRVTIEGSITYTGSAISVTCTGNTKFKATIEKISQACTRSKNQKLYVFLFNLQTNPPTPQVSLTWEQSNSFNFALSYPTTGNLTNAQVGNYVVYVTNATGGYVYSKSICVYPSTSSDCTVLTLDDSLLAIINTAAQAKITAMTEGSNNVVKPTIESVEDRALGYIDWFVSLIPWFFFGTIGVFVMFAVTTRKKVEP